jgi:putative spermidine/putrescine transport system permease protein
MMKKTRNLVVNSILYTAVFLLLFPVLILILWSFAKSWAWPNLLPKEFSLRGFQSVIRSGNNMGNVLLCSICLSITVTVVTLALSIPAAKALGLFNFKGKKLVKMLVLAPLIVPTVSVSMGIHLAFIKIGLANTFLGVVLVHLLPCLPYGVRILTDVFEIIGDKMELQAKVLGAKPFQVFLHVTLPMIMPGILSAGSLIFIVSFSQYFLTFLVGGGRIMTLPLVMFPYIQGGDRVMASSYSLVFLATTLFLLIFLEKTVKSYYRMENHFYI